MENSSNEENELTDDDSLDSEDDDSNDESDVSINDFSSDSSVEIIENEEIHQSNANTHHAISIQENNVSVNFTNNNVDETNVMNSEKNNTTSEEDKSNISDTEIDCCIICGDHYTNSDEHHIVTLRCGHLFGKSCIERWLTPQHRNLRCPTCSRTARRRDIIKIFAQNLRPLDTWKLDESNKKIEEYKKQIEKLNITIISLENTNKRLTTENDYLKSKLIDFHDKNNGGKIDINRFKPPEGFASSSSSSSTKRTKSFHISHLKDISFAEIGSRYLCYSHISDHLVVNIFSSNFSHPMFPCYGVRMFNLESNANESLFLHAKAMKGMVVNSSEGTLITVSLDKTMKYTSIFNKAIIENIQLSIEPWSVTKMPDNNLSCVGYRNSIIDVYDRRQSDEPIFTFKPTSNEIPTPVASMTIVEYSHNHHRKTALLSMHLDSFWLYLSKDNLATNNYECFKLPMHGKTLSCDFDKKSGYTLISFRPSQKHQRTTHYILDFEYDDQTSTIVPNIINILEGGTRQVHLSHSRIYTNQNDEDNDSVFICAPNDSNVSDGAIIWDYKKRFTQPIKTNMLIYDFGLISGHHSSPNGLFTCLGEKIIKLYKI